MSDTTYAFLREAARKREFQVLESISAASSASICSLVLAWFYSRDQECVARLMRLQIGSRLSVHCWLLCCDDEGLPCFPTVAAVGQRGVSSKESHLLASHTLQVVVAEGGPRFDGHLQARKLADAGIQVTAIPDSAVFAMMARANKVC